MEATRCLIDCGGQQTLRLKICFFLVFFLFCFSCIFRATLRAHGGSQARGRIGVVATSLRQSHSNAGSELCLRPAPQLMATPDR